MKRNRRLIYGALGEYIVHGNDNFLNSEQIKIANEYNKELQKLLKESLRERRLRKITTFISKTPSYILQGLSNIVNALIIPFEWIAMKMDDIAVTHENKINLTVSKLETADNLNTYAHDVVLPLLEDAETDDMFELHQKEIKKLKRN
ncbi:hypothetical protein [Staphylococcus delphini]|uniref:Phage protein n=1 Tax=Staphylococcus delphini TaxID=53344 RepID=A0AAX0QTE0_9STAP|nr:hypothetical protein [Staphylococcus delphini]PCF50102.1 hypothetical protein B5C07_07800 [Staphylococcus delphini]PNZ95723.1 hypothetical protein CD148_03340 [Staphylococcus delphini]RIZ56266.1 hypothetical protein CDL68_01625 [Staphylococcus delphini]VED62498.1 Uncharacterised protein [Staphylococcus delphini]